MSSRILEIYRRHPYQLIPGIVLGLLLAVLVARADAQTWQRDVTGTPAAQCEYLNGTGTPTLCDTTHPLPMAAPNILNGGQSYGFNWFNSNPPGFSNFVGLDGGLSQLTLVGSPKCVFLDDINLVCVSITTPSLSISTFHSQDGGRSFSATARAGTNTTFVANINGLGGFQPASTTSSCYVASASNPDPNEFLLTCDFIKWAVQTCTNCAFIGSTPPAIVLGASGTLLAGANDGAGNGTVCRSTNQGLNWTCTKPAQFPALIGSSFGQFVSPTAGTWLAISLGSSSGTGCTNGCIARSTDDGVTWTVQFTFTAITNGTTVSGQINCLSALVCVATDPGTGNFSSNPGHIWRSTDGGVTWTLVQMLAQSGGAATTRGDLRGAQMIGIIPYPDGKSANIILVNANSVDGVTASILPEVYMHTVDAGATWQANTVTAPTPACPNYGASQTGLATQVQRNGRAVIASVAGTCAWYAPLGTGGTVIVGPNGVPWNIDNTGAAPVTITSVPGTVNAAPVQGTNLFNSRTVSAVNTALAVTIAGAGGQRVHIYRLEAECGLAGGVPSVFDILDGATVIWGYDGVTVGGNELITGPLNTTPFRYPFSPGLTLTTGNTATINLGACGAGSSGILWVQADRY